MFSDRIVESIEATFFAGNATLRRVTQEPAGSRRVLRFDDPNSSADSFQIQNRKNFVFVTRSSLWEDLEAVCDRLAHQDLLLLHAVVPFLVPCPKDQHAAEQNADRHLATHTVA